MAEIAGLKLITPTSVAGSGVSLTGAKVIMSSATDAAVNGVFTTNYDNYCLVIRTICASSNPNIYIRMRASGTSDSSSNYLYQNLEVNGTSVTGSRVTSTFARIGGLLDSTLYSGLHVYLNGPYLTQPTNGSSVVGCGGSGAYIKDIAFTHNLSSSYDGFSISIDGAAAFSGSIQIFGFSQ
jgi:hypothetical protein